MEWTTEWPVDSGFYYFYGWPYGGKGGMTYLTRDKNNELKWELDKPEMSIIQVVETTSGSICIRNGNFWYKSDNPVGKFCRIPDVPLPEVHSLIKEKDYED